ncbi:MAG: hypothetical protein F4W68_03255 [Cenarchaeum sp. SB0661_bin_35]|nr:hypothetical protein [Cenarchaeum sp. SB0661_bin_35]MYD59258.1 hypothetical protein [Cenarchaeum sp. SB0678_bin_8]
MVDAKSRVLRDELIFTRTFHMDVNAAWNILYRAAGKVVPRRSGRRATNQRLRCFVLYTKAVIKERSTLYTYLYNSHFGNSSAMGS